MIKFGVHYSDLNSEVTRVALSGLEFEKWLYSLKIILAFDAKYEPCSYSATSSNRLLNV